MLYGFLGKPTSGVSRGKISVLEHPPPLNPCTAGIIYMVLSMFQIISNATENCVIVNDRCLVYKIIHFGRYLFSLFECPSCVSNPSFRIRYVYRQFSRTRDHFQSDDFSSGEFQPDYHNIFFMSRARSRAREIVISMSGIYTSFRGCRCAFWGF